MIFFKRGKKGKGLLVAVSLLLGLVINAEAIVFDFETATGNGTGTVTQTVGGVTMSVEAQGSAANPTNIAIKNHSNLDGTTGNILHDANGAAGEFTFSFSSPVDITSMRVVEMRGATISPIGGSGDTLSNVNTDMGGTDISTNWRSVTSFYVQGGDVTRAIFDNIVINEAPSITTVADKTLVEDSATVSFDLDTADANGDELNITATLSDADLAILKVTNFGVQVGADIDGEAADDYSGKSVSLSADGSRLAIGANGNDGANGINSGHVRIYKDVNGTWTQVGSDIDGEAEYNNNGYSVSLSEDGSRVAIGAYTNATNGTNSGHVRIYKDVNSTWTQVGTNINGEAANDLSGRSVSLSADGLRVAIGADGNDGANGTNSGHVRIYKDVNSTWTKVGADIDGEAANDLSGRSVSLSADGLRVAIGADGNDGANGTNSGHVRIYKDVNSTWTKVGADIDGEAAYDNSGYSVSLSADGSRVAIGAYGNDENGADSGHVRIYKDVNSTWTKVGADIDGEAENDQSGYSVSLSADGLRLAIGAYGNDGSGTGSTGHPGHVRIYKDISGTWTQIGADIDGEAADQSGYSVSLSADGLRVAIGAISNDSNRGHVRIYNTKSSLSITPKANAVGTAVVTLNVNDGTTDINSTFNLTITNTNDIPSSANATFTIEEDTSKTFASNDFNFTDVDAGSSLNSIFITTLPTAGTLTLSDTNVTLNQEILNANIQNLAFTPLANANGTAYATFGFKVNDGDLNSTSAYTATINVTAVADAPVVTSTALTTATQDGVYSYELNASDVEGDSLTWSGNSLPAWLELVSDSSTIDIATGISDPAGITTDSSGNIYVAERKGTTIYKITPEGVVSSFATVNSLDKLGMLVSGNTLYISYMGLNKITKLDLTNPNNGESDWVTTGIQTPLGMVEKDGYIYVAELQGDKILKINLSDATVSEYVTGTRNPFGLGFASNGDLYIASYASKYISKFSNGVLQENIKSFSNKVTDIKIDANDNIYVSTDGGGVKKVPADLSKTTDISTVGIVYEMSLDSKGTLVWGVYDANKVVKLETGTFLSGTPTNTYVGTQNISLTLSDGNGGSVDHNFTITVANVNDLPTSSNVGFTINEDSNKTFASSDFSFTDIDANSSLNSIFITALPSAGTLTLSDANVSLNQEITNITSLMFTPAPNANGTAYATFGFKVNDGDANSTSAYTATINVNAVDDAPRLAVIDNRQSLEDASALNITLTSNDLDGHRIFYTITSSNTNIATVGFNNGKLIVTQVADAYGVVNIEVNATANGLSTLRDFNLTISNVNDAPNIDTTFANLTILEDALSFKVDLNVSDVDGDDLNLTVESNNTALLAVTPSWTNLLSQGSYDGLTLDFNLTTVENANGIAQITVSLNDGTTTSTKVFEVNVNAVNDAPILSQMSNVIVYKDVGDKNITLSTLDVDKDTHTYSAVIANSELTLDISFNGDIMTITPLNGVTGNSDINVTATDGTLSSSKVFNFYVLPLNDGDDVEKVGDISVTQEVNSTITLLNITSNLSLKTSSDTNGTVVHEVTVAGVITKAISELMGSLTEFTSSGAHTTYSDTTVSIEVKTTLTGKATHELTVGGILTKAISEFVGAFTKIAKDANGDIEIVTSLNPDANTSISVVASADGTAQHLVKKGTLTTVATTQLKGASTLIDSNANVTTTVNEPSKDAVVDGETWKFEVVVRTDSNGKSVAKFQKHNIATDTLKDVANTFKPTTPLDVGNEVNIGNIDGVLYIQIKSSVSSDLVVE